VSPVLKADLLEGAHEGPGAFSREDSWNADPYLLAVNGSATLIQEGVSPAAASIGLAVEHIPLVDGFAVEAISKIADGPRNTTAGAEPTLVEFSRSLSEVEAVIDHEGHGGSEHHRLVLLSDQNGELLAVLADPHGVIDDLVAVRGWTAGPAAITDLQLATRHRTLLNAPPLHLGVRDMPFELFPADIGTRVDAFSDRDEVDAEVRHVPSPLIGSAGVAPDAVHLRDKDAVEGLLARVPDEAVHLGAAPQRTRNRFIYIVVEDSDLGRSSQLLQTAAWSSSPKPSSCPGVETRRYAATTIAASAARHGRATMAMFSPPRLFQPRGGRTLSGFPGLGGRPPRGRSLCSEA